jgi:hypothetical protein
MDYWVSGGILALLCILCCALAGVATFILRRSALAERNRLLGGMVALLVTLAIFTPWALLAAWVGEGRLAILGVVVFESFAAAMGLAIGGAFLASFPPKREPSARWMRWRRRMKLGLGVLFAIGMVASLVSQLVFDAHLIRLGRLDSVTIGLTILTMLFTAFVLMSIRQMFRKYAS